MIAFLFPLAGFALGVAGRALAFGAMVTAGAVTMAAASSGEDTGEADVDRVRRDEHDANRRAARQAGRSLARERYRAHRRLANSANDLVRSRLEAEKKRRDALSDTIRTLAARSCALFEAARQARGAEAGRIHEEIRQLKARKTECVRLRDACRCEIARIRGQFQRTA